MKKLLILKCIILFLFLNFIIFMYSNIYGSNTTYPIKPINIIVPMAPGGLGDLGARALAEAMEKHLKQPVVVVNKPGGGMTVGGYAVASSKPDGYTLGLFVNPTSVPEAYSYFYSAPFSSKDIKPICRVYNFFIGISVKGDAPWNNLKELIEYARANPGLKFAHNGKSTSQYIMMTSIARTEKIKLIDVPYDGDGAQIPALLGGHVPIGTAAFAVVKPHIKAKRLKILALLSEKKVPLAPDIPVVGELGYKVPYYESFLALFGPKNTPDEVVKKINEVVRLISEAPEFKEKVQNMDLAIAYEDTSSFEKYLEKFKHNLQNFFKEEGLVK